ncbi:hypothetical protein [Clostridium sp.]|uniref:hypothetical protein n=1 Tax=Clostridium sp. TaxID=1506 RepID=UPI003216FBCC
MDFKIDDKHTINILEALREKYMNTKIYFNNAKSEEETIGMTTPEEFGKLYDSILEQAQAQGGYNFLDKIN